MYFICHNIPLLYLFQNTTIRERDKTVKGEVGVFMDGSHLH